MALTTHWQNYIDGRFVDAVSGDRIAVENPATGETIAHIARAEAADVDLAVQAARRCADSGALTDLRPGKRARMLQDVARELRRRADEIGEVICAESGMGLVDSVDQVECTAQYFDYYGGLADKIEGRYIPLGKGYVDYTIPEPHGVSAQIIPWNFPIELVGRGVAPALAAGNAVVIKSPELDPLMNCYVAEACEAAGFPAGAVNVLAGYGHDCGQALLDHPGVDQLVFTGSLATGRKVLEASARRIVPAVVELGGKSAGIVFEDADLAQVIASTRSGIFFFSGQVCSAMSRLLVHRSRMAEVTEALGAMVDTLTIGSPTDNCDISPVISAGQLQRIDGMVRKALAEGASAFRGGAIASELPGHFFRPTLLTGMTPDMTIMQEEVFGPVLAICPFDDEAEALRIANGTSYGLAAGIFTKDLDRAHRVAARLQAGQVYVNKWFAGGIETPFGGVKQSGFGREKGIEGVQNYYRTKNVGCVIV